MRSSNPTGPCGARLWQAVLLSAIVALAGCSDPEQRTGVVSGTVTLDGAPVQAGTVLFMTDDGHGDAAELRAGGAYTLHLRPGTYKVSVSPPPEIDPLSDQAAGADAAAAIPSKYHDLGSSGLTAEVEGGNNT